MLVLLAAKALAAGPCPAPNEPETIILDEDAAPDGAEFVLTEAPDSVCWWVVRTGQRAEVVHRWSLEARFPSRVEALPDGRAVFVMNDLRLQVRHPADKEYRNLELTLPGKPDVVLAHGHRDWLAVTIPVDAATARVLLIDVDRERALASIALSSDDLSLSFLQNNDALFLDGAHSLVLSESGFTSLGQSR